MLHQGKGEKALIFCCLGKRRLGQRWAGEQGHPEALYHAEAVLSSLEHKTLSAAAGKEAKAPSEPHARRCARPQHNPHSSSPPRRHPPSWGKVLQRHHMPHAIADKPSARRTTVPAMPSQEAVSPLLGGTGGSPSMPPAPQEGLSPSPGLLTADTYPSTEAEGRSTQTAPTASEVIK